MALSSRQEGFGNPDTDLIMNTKKIEAELASRPSSSPTSTPVRTARASPWPMLIRLADAVVTGGNANEVIVLPKLDKVYTARLELCRYHRWRSRTVHCRPDGNIEAEIQVITGATNEIGFNCLSAR